MKLRVNGREVEVSDDLDPSTPLLWVLRDHLGMTGTKFGCGIAQCGACTVHLAGSPVRSCSIPVLAVASQEITTIEGLDEDGNHVLQQAWRDHQVPQCGYCQSGQLMSAAALLERTAKPTDDDIDDAMSGIICRCGTYVRIRAAIHDAADRIGRGGEAGDRGDAGADGSSGSTSDRKDTGTNERRNDR